MNLATYCQILFCPNDDFKCNLPTRQLMTADSFDMDWDSISGAINFKAYWSSARGKEGWKDTHSLQEREKEGSKGSLEVGILMNENTAKGEEEELKFSGVLAQIGKDDRAGEFFLQFLTLIQCSKRLICLIYSTGYVLFPSPTSLPSTRKQR